MTSGRSQMVTTENCGNWHTVVGEICWSPMPKTSMDCDSQLVLHPLRNSRPRLTVNVTNEMGWQKYVTRKCQKYQMCSHQMCYVFFQVPNAPKPVFGSALRELTTLTDSLVGRWRDIPLEPFDRRLHLISIASVYVGRFNRPKLREMCNKSVDS